MRLKLAVIALYATVVAVLATFTTRSLASGDAQNPPQAQAYRFEMGLDVNGKRGPVVFYHEAHEHIDRATGFTPPFLNKPAGTFSCTVCHHRIDATNPNAPDMTDVSNSKQYQKCSNCHFEEGDQRNYVDREGYELNSREAFHRLCVGCHMAKDDQVKAGQYQVTGTMPLKCGECHKRDQVYEAKFKPTVIPEPEVDPFPSGPIDAPIAKLDKAPPFDPPTGFAGPSIGIKTPPQTRDAAVPIADRWRIGFPEDPRYKEGHILNPYRQNVLKGDYPIFGQHNFFVLLAESESFANARRIPVPSNVAAQRPDSEEFFGRGGQFFFRQNFVLSLELFNGDTSFKPVDWRIHVTPVFNINYLNTQENGIVNVDFRRGANRTDGFVALQEAFGEYRLGDTTRVIPFLPGGRSKDKKNPYFDTTSVRVGIQPFLSDFRAFIFNDVQLGARVFGNYADNRYQFNAAYFYMLEKDTNSELNTMDFRDQTVFVANLLRQDTKYKGYTTQFSFHYNNDRPSRHFDENDFLVRPALIGSVRPHGVKAAYFGWAGDGHIGKYNITHALYQAIGHDTDNPIAGRRTSINAQMAAAELSLDRDWIRFKGSLFFASGDSNPFDGTGRGFDSIIAFPEFAGGPFSFWNSQGIPLTNTAVLLTTPGSLLPNLRSSKFEGQANFVNPGIFIYNVGSELELKPTLRAILNLNYSHFHHTEPLRELLFQPDIRRQIGLDYGFGILYRPLLSENAIVQAGFSSLIPGGGFRDIYSSNCSGQMCGQKSKILYSAFVKLKLTY